ncbi:pentatricopeptide repeat domain-containing protein [Spizellomyces punctatus DAOM BR117]|uniref:Pentatricopeptide repeat domain-containing protein n=1 Tax=Spizellomyces punctatus (strain DAOM BR117) TaxID=645134 RepID=A0A0L0HTE8_SPIPD|nr:pentatricopeptide repeat domain-containing protein [Spizellomyces punctatus DAOM BR117]KND04139.1 pentatricopeptide repeat domain-containing protein [Spizellomyces punctatus DAOM BR117]|eukprot:XP_016612178.1 pentatricopeptide repeat domain-containing protein [Spizellomyces punctatus DAOM BR117]
MNTTRSLPFLFSRTPCICQIIHPTCRRTPLRFFLRKPDRFKFVTNELALPKERRISKSDLPPLDTPSEVEADVPTKGEKLEWYNDPFYLRVRVEKLLKNGDEDTAVDLVDRHRGAANAEVFGTLIAGLGRRGNYKKAVKAFREMRRRRIKPTPHSYTALLNAYAQAAYGPLDATARSNCLRDARELWESMEDRTAVHLNAMLNVCTACSSEGGWDLGWNIYRESVPEKGQRDAQAPPPDVITFTIMLRMCAKLGGNDGLDAAMRIWTDVRAVLDRIQPAAAKKKGGKSGVRALAVDDRLLSALLLTCIRAEDKLRVVKGLEFVDEYLDLPVDSDSPTTQQSNGGKISLNTPLLYHLIHLASRLREPALAVRWFKIASSRDVPADEGVYSALIGLLISVGDLEQAWQIVQSADTFRPALGLRVCAAAVRKSGEDSKMWVTRAEEFTDSIKSASVGRQTGIHDLQSLVNLAEIYVAAGRRKDAWDVLERERSNLIDVTRKKLERSVTAAAPLLSEEALGNPSLDGITEMNGKTSALLSRSQRQQSELQTRIKALNLAHELCSELKRQTSNRSERMRFSLIDRQIQEVLGIFEMVDSEAQRLRTNAIEGRKRLEKVRGEGYKLVGREKGPADTTGEGYRVVGREGEHADGKDDIHGKTRKNLSRSNAPERSRIRELNDRNTGVPVAAIRGSGGRNHGYRNRRSEGTSRSGRKKTEQ